MVLKKAMEEITDAVKKSMQAFKNLADCILENEIRSQCTDAENTQSTKIIEEYGRRYSGTHLPPHTYCYLFSYPEEKILFAKGVNCLDDSYGPLYSYGHGRYSFFTKEAYLDHIIPEQRHFFLFVLRRAMVDIFMKYSHQFYSTEANEYYYGEYALFVDLTIQDKKNGKFWHAHHIIEPMVHEPNKKDVPYYCTVTLVKETSAVPFSFRFGHRDSRQDTKPLKREDGEKTDSLELLNLKLFSAVAKEANLILGFEKPNVKTMIRGQKIQMLSMFKYYNAGFTSEEIILKDDVYRSFIKPSEPYSKVDNWYQNLSQVMLSTLNKKAKELKSKGGSFTSDELIIKKKKSAAIKTLNKRRNIVNKILRNQFPVFAENYLRPGDSEDGKVSVASPFALAQWLVDMRLIISDKINN